MAHTVNVMTIELLTVRELFSGHSPWDILAPLSFDDLTILSLKFSLAMTNTFDNLAGVDISSITCKLAKTVWDSILEVSLVSIAIWVHNLALAFTPAISKFALINFAVSAFEYTVTRWLSVNKITL